MHYRRLSNQLVAIALPDRPRAASSAPPSKPSGLRSIRGATLITSQVPVDRWHDLMGDPTLADAILDRAVHNAHRIQLRGESLRRKKAQENAMD